jgi:hypothetical protein
MRLAAGDSTAARSAQFESGDERVRICGDVGGQRRGDLPGGAGWCRPVTRQLFGGVRAEQGAGTGARRDSASEARWLDAATAPRTD